MINFLCLMFNLVTSLDFIHWIRTVALYGGLLHRVSGNGYIGKKPLRVGLQGVYDTHTIAEIKIELCFLPCQLMMAWTYLTLFLQMIGGDLGVSAFPEGESIFAWIGTIAGGEGTAYEGLSYKLSLRFPLDYPFKPPQIKFETMCFHPNVDQFGNICLDILQVSIIVLVELKGCRRWQMLKWYWD